MSKPPQSPSPADDFGATTLDREAISFEELEAQAQPASAEPASAEHAAADSAERPPMWAGRLPGTAVEPSAPIPVAPPPAPEPAPEVSAPVVVPVVPENLAATTLHQKAYVPNPEALEAPALDELTADNRVADAGRAAGLRGRSTSPNAEDALLKVGLGLVMLLIGGLVIAVCAGLGSAFMDAGDDAGEIQE